MSESTAQSTIDLPRAGFALSPQQTRLWELHQSSPIYHARCAVDISGNLDRDRLKAAVVRITSVAEILTTSFARQPGSRVPIQTPGLPVTWLEDSDPTAGPGDAVDSDPFSPSSMSGCNDLENIPALRAQLQVGRAAGRSRLLLYFNPLCVDSATCSLIVGSIASAYESDAAVEAGLSYFQFAAWQNDLLTTPDQILDEAREFWSAQSRESPASGHPLRLKIPRSASFKPKGIAARVESELAAAIASAARDCNLAECDFLFACWCAFLWRWIDRGSGMVGFMSNGRSFDELRDVFGLVERYLPVPIDGQPGITFREYASNLRTRLDLLQEWQDYFLFAPRSKEEGSPGYLDFAFAFEERIQPIHSAGLTWTLSSQNIFVERFDLKLCCVRDGEQLEIQLDYDSGLYERASLEKLLDGWLALVRCAVQKPDCAIDRLEMIGSIEYNELTIDLNTSTREYPDACFHELFQQQALVTPDRIAVRCNGVELTYRELDEASDRLAAYLQSIGAGPEKRVAISLARSERVLTAILAVMKSGAAYVPLDNAYPLERLNSIIESASPVAIISETLREPARFQTNAFITLLDSQDHAINGTLQPSGADPDNLVYVLYTSGSTGRPKGVMVQHRALVNYLSWAAKTYRMAEGLGTIVDSPIGFDLTLTSLLAPLITGQTVILVPEEEGLEALSQAIQSQRDITLVKATPSHLEVLRSLLPSEKAKAVRRLVIGGEMLHWDSLSFWKQNAIHTKLINEYGPTETVVGSSWYEASADSTDGDSVPIGRPIANTQLYVLDDSLQLVPKGAAGELCIAGDGVTRGYLNQPALTAEKFVPNPFPTLQFPSHPPIRLYRTGDRVRYLADGNLEYLGRTDHQVKIRGFRIELGEVEALLMSEPSVAEAVAVVREDELGDKRIVAYLVGDWNNDLLRSRLRERLPEHMIPSAFVHMESLPLTANGKIDRNALPAPDKVHGEEMVAPRTPVEEAIAGIWAEVLHREHIGVFDNFFDLGGHSLLVIQVIARIREMFDVDVAVRSIFDEPTIASFVELMLADRESRPKIEKLAELLASLNRMSVEDLQDRLSRANS